MTSTNVSTGKPKTTGAVFRAAGTVTPPTSADASLSSDFKELGYVSEDGVTNRFSTSTDPIRAWGGQTVLQMQTEQSDTWKMTLIEPLNAEVLKAVFGDSAVTAGSTSIIVAAAGVPTSQNVYVIDMVLTGNTLKRIVIPCGVLSEVGEIVYKDDEPIGYEVTITALPDSTGKTHYEYIKLAA